MRAAQRQRTAAVGSVVGRSQERAVASLLSPGGTHAMEGKFTGMNDVEVVASLLVLPEDLPLAIRQRADNGL